MRLQTPNIIVMEKSNLNNSGNLNKCPYQSMVYGKDNCDLIYRKSYNGDWGHWDDLPEDAILTNCSEANEIENSVADPKMGESEPDHL